MKLKMKLMAAALALAASAGAHAAIDNGAGGNGELFFNIWDASNSYTRSLEISIDSFQSQLAAAGNLNLSWAADATYTSFLAGVTNQAALKWNIAATDTSGNRRTLTTYSLPEDTTPLKDDVARSMALAMQGKINNMNTGLGTNDSAVFAAGTAGYAGDNASFGTQYSGKLGFDSTGSLARNSYANGLGFMRVDSLSSGINPSKLNEYYDNGTAVNAWLDQNGSLNIAAAIPEPSEYALMLAGLGMLGFMARRRLNNRA